MTKRLKCWKKQSPHRYFGNDWWMQKKTGDTVSVSSKIHGLYHVYTPLYYLTRRNETDAMKQANEYMEEHDSC